MSGAGVTLMPNLGVHHEVASGELVALSIAHPILSAPECQALLRLGRPLSSAASELMRRIELRLPAFSEGGRAREARQRPANDAAFREQCAGKRHPWLMLVRKWRYQAVSRQILPASDKIQAHPEVLIMSVMSDIKIRPLERGDLHFRAQDQQQRRHHAVLVRGALRRLTTNWSRCTTATCTTRTSGASSSSATPASRPGWSSWSRSTISTAARNSRSSSHPVPGARLRQAATRIAVGASRAEPAQGLPGGGQGQCRRRPYL